MEMKFEFEFDLPLKAPKHSTKAEYGRFTSSADGPCSL